jgi:hypothetical protein
LAEPLAKRLVGWKDECWAVRLVEMWADCWVGVLVDLSAVHWAETSGETKAAWTAASLALKMADC